MTQVSVLKQVRFARASSKLVKINYLTLTALLRETKSFSIQLITFVNVSLVN